MDDRPIGFLSYSTYHQLKQSMFPLKRPGIDNIVATETYCIHLVELPAGFALSQNRKISEYVWDAFYRKGIPLAWTTIFTEYFFVLYTYGQFMHSWRFLFQSFDYRELAKSYKLEITGDQLEFLL